MTIRFSFPPCSLHPPGNLLVGAPGTGNWTILAWLRTHSSVPSYVRTVWYLNNNHALRLNASNQLQFVYGTGSDTIATLATGQWYCIVVTKQGTTAARYWLNGVYQSQRTTSLSNDDAAASTLGAWNGAQDFLLYEGLGGVKAWDAVLTDAEIAQESAVVRPARTAGLRAFYPFFGASASDFSQDHSGNGRHLTAAGTVVNSFVLPGPPVGYGAPVLAVGGVYGPPPSIVFATPARRVRTAQPVTITGGQPLNQPLIELALMADASGRYTHVIDRARIRAVSGSFGFQRLGAYMTDNTSVSLELRNDDGAYTQGGGLWVGQWGQVRLAGSGEVLFTGRITEMTPGYGVNQPYVRVTLDTLRNSLNIPARSVLLKDTHVGAAAEALLQDVRLTPPMGELIWDYGAWDDGVWWPGKGRALRLYGDVWTGLAAAGGYGRPDGELDVLGALGDLMTAEDGRAVWGRDNALELYSRQWLDDAREGASAYTLTDDEIVDLPLSIGDQYVNEVAVQWTPTYWQAGATVFRYAPDTPASVKPGEFRDFSVRFRVEGDNRVIAVETPVVAVTSSGGSVSWAWTDGVSATGGNLRVSNAGPDAAGISAVVVTGAALIASTVVEERRRMAFEQTLYGVRAKTVRATLIDRSTEAVARADREFVTGNERASYAGRVALRPRTRAEAVRWLTLPFASGVEVNSARASHHARYLAIGVDWRIGEGGVPVDVTLALEPVVTGGFLRWDGTDSRGAWDSGRWAF